ncbi:MAG: lyase family protein, partial [Candidatus Levyibacteriota bacterium]
MVHFDYTTYLSPFTFRYGSPEMRTIWSEVNRRKIWRSIWVALAKAEEKAGLVTKEEVADLVAHQNDIDIEKAKEIEKEIYHEVMAEINVYAHQSKIGGGKIHLGATSTDVLDNTLIVQSTESLRIIENKLKELLKNLSGKIAMYQDTPCMGYTHLQPAEPTTMGYRFAFYAQDLLMDLELLRKMQTFLKGKGMKGAVGTSASYVNLLEQTDMSAETLERDVLTTLGIDAVTVSG